MWGVFHPSQQLNCCHNVGSGCFRLTRLAISLRSVSAITAHFKLSREVRGCIVCGRVTLPHDVYFTCGICEERHDVCVRCYDQTSGDRTVPLGVGPRTQQAAMADHPMHRDVLPLLVDTAPLGLAKSSAPLEELLLDGLTHGEGEQQDGTGAAQRHPAPPACSPPANV